VIGYKLFRQRNDGTLGSLFINRSQRLRPNVLYLAKAYPTKGFALRPGWHVCAKRSAPHLSKKGRVWKRVWFEDHVVQVRPARQGGVWYIAKRMIIL